MSSVVKSLLKKTEGIVIRTTAYAESDVIITIYSKQIGKIGMLARGAKKTNSRLAAISQLFTYGNYLFRHTRGLGTLSQGEIIHSFRGIREDLFKTAYAAYIVELTDKLTDDFVASAALFDLLYFSLNYINDNYDAEIVSFIFETKMLAFAGITPRLDRCAVCGKREDRFFSFSVIEGGFLCRRCQEDEPRSLHVSEATAKLLKLFLSMDIRRLGKISVKKTTRNEINKVLTQYYDTYSGLHLKSKKFLEQLSTFQ